MLSRSARVGFRLRPVGGGASRHHLLVVIPSHRSHRLPPLNHKPEHRRRGLPAERRVNNRSTLCGPNLNELQKQSNISLYHQSVPLQRDGGLVSGDTAAPACALRQVKLPLNFNIIKESGDYASPRKFFLEPALGHLGTGVWSKSYLNYLKNCVQFEHLLRADE